jgi:hypothetical protein
MRKCPYGYSKIVRYEEEKMLRRFSLAGFSMQLLLSRCRSDSGAPRDYLVSLR